MSRRTPIFVAIGLAGLVAFYVGYWFVLARIMRQDIDNWTQNQRAAGYTVSMGEPQIDGFPFAVRARMAAPAVAAPGGLWQWQGPDLDLTIRPWAPLDWQFAAPGHHRMDMAGDKPRWDQLDADGLVFDLHIGFDGLVDRVTLDLANLVLLDSRLGKSGVASARLDAHLPWPPPGDPTKSALDLDLDATAVDIPDSQTSPLGQRVDNVHAVIQVMAAPPPEASPRQMLLAWQNAGGAIQLREGSLAWGPLSMLGDSTIALDRSLQPVAAGTLYASGLAETLDAFVAAGMLQEEPARLARFMFAALAKTPPDGGRPQVKLPLTLQDGFLYLGPIRLAPVPPIDWRWLPG
jgi:hypothetical protein